MYSILYQRKNYSQEDLETIKELKEETVVKNFIWAQWDAQSQVLYYIHHRKAVTSIFTEDTAEKSHMPPCTSPTLSGLQFHDNLPPETMVQR